MAPKLEPIHAKFTGNASGFTGAVAKADNSLSRFTSNVRSRVATITESLSAISTFALPAALISGAGFGLKLAGEIEVLTKNFKTLTKSAEVADQQIRQIREYAASTPYTIKGLAKTARTLLQYQVAADELQPTLRALGDISLGNQERMSGLAVAYGQVQSKGKLLTEELNQMRERGFNPLEEIARTSGREITELTKAMERGEISSRMVADAFQSAAGAGGDYFNAIEDMSDALPIMWSKLVASAQELGLQMGEVLLPTATSLVKQMTYLVKWARDLDPAFVQGTVKTIAITGAFSGALLVIPRLIAAGATLIKTIRAIGSASAIAQALAGPAGWATLAVSLGVAATAAVAVDSVFAQYNETLGATNEQAKAVADGQTEIAKTAAEAEAKLAELESQLDRNASELDKWAVTARSLERSLETPFEKYERKVEDLNLAVRKGGLSFELFRRGVQSAYQELHKLNSAKIDNKAIEVGSDEDIALLSRSRAPTKDTTAADTAIAEQLSKLHSDLQNDANAADELKQRIAAAGKEAAQANVEKLKEDLSNAQKKLLEIQRTAERLRDIDFHWDFSALLTTNLSNFAVADVKNTAQRKKLRDQHDEQVRKIVALGEQLTKKQAALDNAEQDVSLASVASGIAETNARLGAIEDAIRNQPAPIELDL